MTTKQNRIAEKPLPLEIYQAVAEDIREHHRLSQPKKDRENTAGEKMREWVPVNPEAEVPVASFEYGRDSFPPQNLVGSKNAAEAMNALVFAFNRLDERPRELLNLSGPEALAKIIDIPTITGDMIEAVAAGEKKLASSLAYEIDRMFGLQGQLERFSVKPHPKDAAIADLPFKMEALPYTGRLPDHAQLLNDIYHQHRTDGTGLVKTFRIRELSSVIFDYIRIFPFEQDLFENVSHEPLVGLSLSRKLDREFFSMQNGPFTHYATARTVIQYKAEDPRKPGRLVPDPDHPGRVVPVSSPEDADSQQGCMIPDPVKFYDFPITTRYTYFDLYHPEARPPVHGRKSVLLNRKRKKAFHKLSEEARDKLDHAAYDLRFSTVLGLTAPTHGELAELQKHPELAPLNDIVSHVLPTQNFISPEQRKKEYEQMSSLRHDWAFINQRTHGDQDFRTAFDQAMLYLHQNLSEDRGINPDTALGGVFQPVTQDRKPIGEPTFYVATHVVDSMLRNGLLVTRNVSGKYSDYINRAIPA